MVNVSLNQVLMRTLNTSLTALLPILSLLVIGSFILGATTLQEFAIALLVGLGAGAYSSIFIASPLLAILKEREPRFAAVRERLARGGGRHWRAARARHGNRDGNGTASAGSHASSSPPLVPGQVPSSPLTSPSSSRPAITAKGRKQRRRR